MRREPLLSLIVFSVLLFHASGAAAFDWDPVTDAEKSMTSNPLDPGSGAVVLFKRGEIQVQRANVSLWITRITTYTRIKILSDAGREAGNVVIDAPKYVRVAKVDGRTILPSGEIIPLDTSKVFHGVAYRYGRNFAMLTTSFPFSSVQPGAILEYQTEQTEDWFFPPPWIFDTPGLATLQSSLRLIVSSDIGMAQLPLQTTANPMSATQKQTTQGVETDYAVQNLRPVREEPFAVPFRDRAVMVSFTPAEIVFSGQLIPIIKTWDDVAKEVTEMFTNVTKNNKEAASKAKQLAEKLPDPRSRAEAIYKYLQQNVTSTNLGGIALGRTVDDVISAKRGDPDDINALFASMLRDVKVDADLVLVATHNWQTLFKQFPNLNQFSRLIVRVNLKEGPVFADAAAASAPFGDLPWYEKDVLSMAVKGTKLHEAPIPPGSVDDNVSVSKFSLQLSSNWKAEGDAEVNLKGADAMNLRDELIGQSPAKIDERLHDYLGFGHGDATVSNLTVPDVRDTSQLLVLKAHVQESVVDAAGPGEVLLNPWMGQQYRSPVFKSTQRQSFILFESPKKDVVTSTWKLPLDIRVEKLPPEVSVQGDLADYSHSCTESADTVTCTRSFTLKKTAMTDPKGYPATKKFFDEVAQHDQEVILLRKE